MCECYEGEWRSGEVVEQKEEECVEYSKYKSFIFFLLLLTQLLKY